MNRTVVCLFVFLALSTVALCQSSSYYKAIQKGAPTQIQPKQFKEMEENALKEYSWPEPYELLATSFGNTTRGSVLQSIVRQGACEPGGLFDV